MRKILDTTRWGWELVVDSCCFPALPIELVLPNGRILRLAQGVPPTCAAAGGNTTGVSIQIGHELELVRPPVST